MFIPSINDLTKIADSRYTLVMLASKRSRQIIEGQNSLIETSSKKPVSIALEEIMEGKIKYKKPEVKGYK